MFVTKCQHQLTQTGSDLSQSYPFWSAVTKSIPDHLLDEPPHLSIGIQFFYFLICKSNMTFDFRSETTLSLQHLIHLVKNIHLKREINWC